MLTEQMIQEKIRRAYDVDEIIAWACECVEVDISCMCDPLARYYFGAVVDDLGETAAKSLLCSCFPKGQTLTL
jgi:hypothetical protein